MNAEARTHSPGSVSSTCQNCKNQFVIEPDDFAFYEKIKVPPPTWCPECRLIRRLTFRNERTLYRRSCDLCHASIVTRYPTNSPFPVYCVPSGYSDTWDPLEYGQAYDFSRPFFAQFRELQQKVPHPALYVINAVNSEYANQSKDIKNVYLGTSIINAENVCYSYRIDDSRDVLDTAFGRNIERCSNSTDLLDCNNVHFSRYAKGSYDGRLLYDVRGSRDCFGCVGLRNKQYCLFNEQLTKEAYRSALAEWDTGSYRTLQKGLERLRALVASHPKRFAMTDNVVQSTGDNL